MGIGITQIKGHPRLIDTGLLYCLIRVPQSAIHLPSPA
jgi:hypothetical protein